MLLIIQDCKEFQGELFGICNLFRDLSDKLFTSKIIGSQVKQGQEDGDLRSKKQEFSELETFFPFEENSETIISRSEASKPHHLEKVATTNPLLEDLGES